MVVQGSKGHRHPRARISLMMVEFSSCLLADSAINLDSDSSVVSLRVVYEEFPLLRCNSLNLSHARKRLSSGSCWKLLISSILFVVREADKPKDNTLTGSVPGQDVASREEFLVDKAKSRKRSHDDQDPLPPPPKDSDHSKKKRHDSDTSGSSKQKQASPSVQPINKDILIPYDVNISDSKYTGFAHLPKITTKQIECHQLLTDKIDLVNPEGHRIVPNVTTPLPLGGPPGQDGCEQSISAMVMINQCLTGKTSRKHNLHQRLESSLNLAEDDYRLGNLKFVPKAEERRKMKSRSKADQSKKSTTTKQPKPVPSKPSKHAPAKKPKVAQEKPSEPSPAKQPKRSVDDTSANIVRDNSSPVDAETEVDTDITTNTANTEILYAEDAQEKSAKLDEGHAGSDPGKTPESRPPPEHEHMDEDQAGPNPRQSFVALAEPNLELMHNDFIATVYLKVYESLKHTTKEHVHLENPLSSSGTLSSMKNLEDAFTFDDQFLNDKPTKEEPGKATVETKAESMVT
nr:hypothetical protein [Tanacetum cinerariifolium]